MIANQVRGTDSTGIFQVDRENNISWRKQAVCASKFLAESEAKTQVARAGSMLVNVGHVRQATSGHVITDNAHPFEAVRDNGSRVIGVHNGSLIHGWRDKPDGKDFAVDSAWMIHMIAKEGADAFEHFNGAFALVWFDNAHPEHIFMARNKDRPLCYMVNDDRSSILGASELGMLTWLAGRHSFKLSKDEPFHVPFYLGDGKIYKFSLEDLGNFTTVEFPKYKYTSYPASNGGNPSSYAGSQGAPRTELRHYRDNVSNNSDVFDDSIPWETERYYNRGSMTRVEKDWNYEEQESIIQKVKDELQAARYTPEKKVVEPGDTTLLNGEVVDVEDYHVVDEDALERAMHKAIIEQAGQVEPPPIATKVVLDDMMLLGSNTASATSGEIETAKEMGIFGKVIEFKGIDYDEENSSCLGVFTMRDPATGEEVDSDGEIRYLTRKVAEDLYINRSSHLAIIIGYHKGADWAVCTMPSVEQKQFIFSSITPKDMRAVN